ncbi:39S ribosomal protein L10, mitochondrial [Pristis pectinata]|uniref:39S ribosomal protein L10, mitochondrial n=1 Tax=Pristis pectinata TaxID=685728 RepID=UPI00223CBDFD|nr:39S ribosomal protein L10, mitochondrial [Pristis pectinata]XP_051894623.1 39S ribosomal protein L10, mitochondrial [Pristis pectinata]
MAAVSGRLLLSSRGWFPFQFFVRHGSKAVTRHRKPMHILRQKLLAVTEYIPPKPAIPERCIRPRQQEVQEPSTLEKLIRRDVEMAFRENKMIAVFQNNSINSEELRLLRHRLLKHNIRMKFFPNQVLRSYLTDTKYKNLLPLFIGHNIIIVSKEPKTKELLQIVRSTTQITLLGACIENALFSRQGVVKYSRLPGLQVIRGEVVSGLTQMTSQTYQLLNNGPVLLTTLLEQYLKQQSEAATGQEDSTKVELKEAERSQGS